jgi:hypothetical protein
VGERLDTEQALKVLHSRTTKGPQAELDTAEAGAQVAVPVVECSHPPEATPSAQRGAPMQHLYEIDVHVPIVTRSGA